jgi:HK97 family phage prohead protease
MASNNEVIIGLAIPYGELSTDLGGFREKFAQRAFSDSLVKHRDVFAFHSHDSSRILGRSLAGTLQLRESAAGIDVVISNLKTQEAFDALRDVRVGNLSSFSFGFICEDDDWEEDRDQVIRTVKRAKLLEVPLVARPAYPTTHASASAQRSASDNRQLKIDRMAAEQRRTILKLRAG